MTGRNSKNKSYKQRKQQWLKKIHKMDHKLKVDFQLLEHRLSHHRECLETLMRNIKKEHKRRTRLIRVYPEIAPVEPYFAGAIFFGLFLTMV